MMSALGQQIDVRPQEAPAKPHRTAVQRLSIILRRTHMFVALFLTPWLTMYALSTVVFNHYSFFEELYGGSIEKFETERELSYGRTFGPDAEPEEVGER